MMVQKNNSNSRELRPTCHPDLVLRLHMAPPLTSEGPSRLMHSVVMLLRLLPVLLPQSVFVYLTIFPFYSVMFFDI